MKYKFNPIKKTPIITNHLNLGGKNPSGEEISLNSKYLLRGNKPWMPVMGEIHSVRLNRDEWKKELAKMKAGGISLVSTYLFWIYHEETEGKFNFSGNRDIRAFVELCQELELEVVVRIGPWAHGECRNGGFPDWLLKKELKRRSNDEAYLHYVNIWYKKVAEQLEGLYYKDGGPIVAVQLDNELVCDAEHLLKLKEIAKEYGIIVPLYTVTGWGRGGAKIPVDEVLPVFGGYPEAPWEKHINKREPSVHFFFNDMRNDSDIGNDVIDNSSSDGWRLPYERYPFATCELGGGIQITHLRRPKINPMDIYSISLTKLGSGNNLPGYYMYHGGTNQIGELSALNETGYNDYSVLSYDFQAPIGEFGIVREHCGLLNMLHLFIHDFGDRLAAMDVALGNKVEPYDNKSLRYAMRTDGESGFVFVNHYQRLEHLEDAADVQFEVNNSKVFPEKGINISGDIAFFMPFNIKLGDTVLEYSTTQMLCVENNTYFFLEIPGIKAEYKIGGRVICESDFVCNDIRIVTLKIEQAKKMRRLDDGLYIGIDCDLYMLDNKLYSAQDGDFSYLKWNGDKFEKYDVKADFKQAEIKFEKVDKPNFKPEFYDELQFGGKREVTWQRITVTGDEGYVHIPYRGDAAQIYADGKLVADEYWCGIDWHVTAKLLHGKEVYFAYSELKNDCYIEE